MERQLQMSHTTQTVLGAVLAIGALPASAAHAAKPTLRLPTLPAATANAPTAFDYTATGLAGAKLVLQRRQGTAGVWKTSKVLAASRAGTSTLPKLPLGAYKFRLAAQRRGRTVAKSFERTLKVFGLLPFSDLLGKPTESYTGRGAVFEYVIRNYGGGNAGGGERAAATLTVAKTKCRSVHVEFIPGSFDDSSPNSFDSGESGTAAIVQESRDPVAQTVPAEERGELDAPLTPGESWSITIQDHYPGHGDLITWYINGSADCYSSEFDTE